VIPRHSGNMTSSQVETPTAVPASSVSDESVIGESITLSATGCGQDGSPKNKPHTHASRILLQADTHSTASPRKAEDDTAVCAQLPAATCADQQLLARASFATALPAAMHDTGGQCAHPSTSTPHHMPAVFPAQIDSGCVRLMPASAPKPHTSTDSANSLWQQRPPLHTPEASPSEGSGVGLGPSMRDSSGSAEDRMYEVSESVALAQMLTRHAQHRLEQQQQRQQYSMHDSPEHTAPIVNLNPTASSATSGPNSGPCCNANSHLWWYSTPIATASQRTPFVEHGPQNMDRSATAFGALPLDIPHPFSALPAAECMPRTAMGSGNAFPAPWELQAAGTPAAATVMASVPRNVQAPVPVVPGTQHNGEVAVSAGMQHVDATAHQSSSDGYPALVTRQQDRGLQNRSGGFCAC
jgi:hypothetical protein